jgi:hypothetical protein
MALGVKAAGASETSEQHKQSTIDTVQNAFTGENIQ